MSLWRQQQESRLKSAEPLAARMRPRSLDEFAGQAHFLGEGKLLRRMLQADQMTSVLFYGPPGTGKTTLARLIAAHTKRHFEQGNAASIGVADVRAVLEAAKKRLEQDGVRTIFFLDEIHRFSRAQQDVLLGDVERGVITLVGATTENPYFAVNAALVSRSAVFQFEPVPVADTIALLRRALTDPERGYGTLGMTADDDALDLLATRCDGDARKALSALEVAVLSESKAGNKAGEAGGPPRITLAVAEESIQQKALAYDKNGDQHHDVISAFIKSVRGSDPDAAVYWLARMLASGEDPLFIARRIAILASEDIGNADPRALSVAAACYDIVHRIGMPEARITLSQAATYLACAPKSNAAYAAINEALADVKGNRTVPVPKHLRSKIFETGENKAQSHPGYQYAHDGDKGFVAQEYLGVDKTYYRPTDRGYEKQMRAYLAWLKGE